MVDIRGVKQDFILYKGGWYLQVHLLRDGLLILRKMASLMVLVMVCDSLPTMEKLYNLI